LHRNKNGAILKPVSSTLLYWWITPRASRLGAFFCQPSIARTA